MPRAADVTRREFLLTAGAAFAAGAIPAGQLRGFEPDVELAIAARPGEASILPGRPTRVWRYETRLVSGPAGTVTPVPDSYLAPTIRVRTGQKVRVRFSHDLPEPTIIHWHGLDVPSAADGHPRQMIPAGRTFIYEFEVGNRAGTYWYHPHHHNRTGPQVYNGLAGLLLVADDEEAALDLPSGDRELLWVLQDRRFDGGNQLVYGGGGMEQMNGFLGDHVLVNGRMSGAPIALASAVYRVRLLNGSNARVYKLAWADRTPMTVIGTDGGLLERPIAADTLVLAPGERIDLLLDLRERPVGTRLELRSLPFDGVEMGMMGMGGGRGRGMGGGPANGAPLAILRAEVMRREPASAWRLPDRLSTYGAAWAASDLDRLPQKTRAIGFARMAMDAQRPHVRDGRRGTGRDRACRHVGGVGVRQHGRRLGMGGGGGAAAAAGAAGWAAEWAA